MSRSREKKREHTYTGLKSAFVLALGRGDRVLAFQPPPDAVAIELFCSYRQFIVEALENVLVDVPDEEGSKSTVGCGELELGCVGVRTREVSGPLLMRALHGRKEAFFHSDSTSAHGENGEIFPRKLRGERGRGPITYCHVWMQVNFIGDCRQTYETHKCETKETGASRPTEIKGEQERQRKQLLQKKGNSSSASGKQRRK